MYGVGDSSQFGVGDSKMLLVDFNKNTSFSEKNKTFFFINHFISYQIILHSTNTQSFDKNCCNSVQF